MSIARPETRAVKGRTLTREQVGRLVAIAGVLHAEAQLCAQAARWRAALVFLGSAIEAGVLATACCCEQELRDGRVWPEKGKPITMWELGRLLQLAHNAGWLPRTLDKTTDDAFALLEGGVGDAVQFLLRVRNAAIHPASYVLSELGADFDDSTLMEPTYKLIEGITGAVFEKLHHVVESL